MRESVHVRERVSEGINKMRQTTRDVIAHTHTYNHNCLLDTFCLVVNQIFRTVGLAPRQTASKPFTQPAATQTVS